MKDTLSPMHSVHGAGTSKTLVFRMIFCSVKAVVMVSLASLRILIVDNTDNNSFRLQTNDAVRFVCGFVSMANCVLEAQRKHNR